MKLACDCCGEEFTVVDITTPDHDEAELRGEWGCPYCPGALQPVEVRARCAPFGKGADDPAGDAVT